MFLRWEQLADQPLGVTACGDSIHEVIEAVVLCVPTHQAKFEQDTESDSQSVSLPRT